MSRHGIDIYYGTGQFKNANTMEIYADDETTSISGD